MRFRAASSAPVSAALSVRSVVLLVGLPAPPPSAPRAATSASQTDPPAQQTAPMARRLPLPRLDLHAAPRETPGGAQVVGPSLGHDPATLLDRDPAHSHLFSCCRRVLHQVELLPLLPAPLPLSSPRRRFLSPLHHRQSIGGLWGSGDSPTIVAPPETTNPVVDVEYVNASVLLLLASLHLQASRVTRGGRCFCSSEHGFAGSPSEGAQRGHGRPAKLDDVGDVVILELHLAYVQVSKKFSICVSILLVAIKLKPGCLASLVKQYLGILFVHHLHV